MTNTWRSYLTLLFVLFAPLSAVVYFDFPRFNPRNVTDGGYPSTSDTDVVLPEGPQTGSSMEANLPETEPSEENNLAMAEPSERPPPTLGEVERFLAEFGEQLRKLPEGHVILVAPKAMKVSDKREVEARVGYGVPIEVLEKGLSADDRKELGVLRVLCSDGCHTYRASFYDRNCDPGGTVRSEGISDGLEMERFGQGER